MKYSKEWLIKEIRKGEEFNFILFWGHQPLKNGAIGKTCFSQWFVSPFEVDNITYPTAEHWMMASKARLFNDLEILDEILKSESPGKVKSLGRKIRNFNDQTWNQHKYELIKEGNYYKFSQNLKLKEYLLQTGDGIIVEASPNDSIWGIGMSQDEHDALKPERWKGLNLLGFAIMEVRDKLRE